MSSRILVVGAGATGGYFGGRLRQAGRDVTFLVRPQRASELADFGLHIESPHGNVALADPAIVVADELEQCFDLILLSCKAYDLEEAIAAFSPAVGPTTTILPLLNGMRHLDILQARCGASNVVGGLCIIAATLDERRSILHLNKLHTLSFGERAGGVTDRLQWLTGLLSDAGFDAQPSQHIVHEMWEKWVFLATLAASTCLMRAPIGAILATPNGKQQLCRLFDECCAIAKSEGYAPRTPFLERARAMLTDEDSTLTASMLRDIESHSRIEADHVVGDLLRRRGHDSNDPLLLQLAYAHLKAYEAQRACQPARNHSA